MQQQKDETPTFNYCCWDSEFEDIKKADKYVIYFTGTEAEDGTNWCPDCAKAKPFFKDNCVKNCQEQKIPYQLVTAGLRPDWKDPENPLRKHASLNLTNIPTLIMFQKGKIVRKLVEDQICDQEQLKAFFED